MCFCVCFSNGMIYENNYLYFYVIIHLQLNHSIHAVTGTVVILGALFVAALNSTMFGISQLNYYRQEHSKYVL